MFRGNSLSSKNIGVLEKEGASAGSRREFDMLVHRRGKGTLEKREKDGFMAIGG